jgi:hypothetical protein
MFSEAWLEEHGNAPFQGGRATIELENSVPTRQERLAGGVHQQNQSGGWQDSLAVVKVTDHHLKIHRGDTGVKTWGDRCWEGLKRDRGIPWWRALNASLDQA